MLLLVPFKDVHLLILTSFYSAIVTCRTLFLDHRLMYNGSLFIISTSRIHWFTSFPLNEKFIVHMFIDAIVLLFIFASVNLCQKIVNFMSNFKYRSL